MKIKKRVLPFFLLVSVGSMASSDTTTGPLRATSEQGRELTLDFGGEPLSTSTEEAILCANPSGQLAAARLWMPAHGHSSATTLIEERDDGCFDIDNIKFTMPGEWEVKVTFDDEDQGVFRLTPFPN